MKNKGTIFIIILLLAIVILLFGLFMQNRNQSPNVVPDENDIPKVKPEGDTGTNTDPKPEESIITQDEIKELEIKVEYVLDKVEVDYEVKENGKIKGEYYNTITGENLKNDEAVKFIENNLLSINYNNPQSEIIDLVLNNLGLDEGFNEFDLEVIYKDNTKTEFEFKQR